MADSRPVPVTFSGRPVERPADSTRTIFLSYARADDDPDHHDAGKSFMRRLYTDLTAAPDYVRAE